MTQVQLAKRNTADFEVLRNIVERIKVAMLVTRDSQGLLHSRPVQTLQFDDQARLWFFIEADSGKVHEIDHDGGQINLSYADPSQQDYASISGAARFFRDPERAQELWSKWAQIWFPKGVNDPNLMLLQVTIEQAQYWDAPNSTIGRLWGAAKALVTGDGSNLGENVKIDPHPQQFR